MEKRRKIPSPFERAGGKVCVMEAYEEFHHMLPVQWLWRSGTGNFMRMEAGSKEGYRLMGLMHTVFLYCISPIVFNKKYMDEDLNAFAAIVGFLPIKGEEIFNPEEHNADLEEKCYRMVSVAHKFMFFMFSKLNEGHLPYFANRVLRFGRDVKSCLRECQSICNDSFQGDIHDEKHVALFAITLIVVSDHRRLEVIADQFKFLQEHTADDCRRYAELAKECVKKEDYANAISLYKQSIAIRPYDHFTYSNLAQIYLKMKKYQFAQWCAHRAIWLDHSWPKSHYRFIKALECQGQLQKAWSISATVAVMADNNQGGFTGSDELLQQLIQQRVYLTAKLMVESDEVMMESSSKNRKKKRAKGTSNVTLDSSLTTSKPANSVKKNKNDQPLEAVNGSSKTSKDADVSERTSAKECMERTHPDSISVDVTKQKSVKNALPNSKVARTKFSSENFKKLLQEGSEALIMFSYKVACQKYSMAMSMVETIGKKACGLSEVNVIVLKYCHAKACIGKVTNEDINLGLKMLDEIINDHYTISFPLAYYGKALGFVAQNRYKEAKGPLQSLCSIIDNKIKLEVYEYPNCESKIIEESHPEKLQDLVKALVSTCNAPPPPNAICRYDDSSHRTEIYFSDPEFQGFAQIICHERCHLCYHMSCWKEIKESKKFYFEKDFLGKPCITPDCNSSICKIELFGADGMKRKTFPGEEEVKQKFKDSTPKPLKENKKVIKPVVKKICNVTEPVTVDRLMVHRQSDSSTEEKRNDFAVEDTRKDAVMVLQKNKFSDDNIPQVEKKKQLKKSKTKEVLPLDFAKTDDPRIEQLKTLKVAAEQDSSKDIPPRHFCFDPEQPFALPAHARGNVAETEKWLQQSCNGEAGDMEDGYLIGDYVGTEELFLNAQQDLFDKYVGHSPLNWDGFSNDFANAKAFAKFCMENVPPSNIPETQMSAMLPPDSTTQALDFVIDGGSHKKGNSSITDVKGKDVENNIKINQHITNTSISSESNISKRSKTPQSDDLSDGEDSASDLSYNTEDTGNKYLRNAVNSKQKRKFFSVIGDGLKDDAELKSEFGSQTKLGSTQNGYQNIDKNSKKSYGATDDEESSITCIRCLKLDKTIEMVDILEEDNSCLTSQCQEFKDKLVQVQNELQITKKATESEIADLKEELEKYKKLNNNIQISFDSNAKKWDVEKRKLNADIKSLTDKIDMLSFEKDKVAAEQSKLDAMVSVKHSSMEEERKQRFKAEDEVKVLQSNFNDMEANYKQTRNNEHILTEKVKVQEIQIKALLNKIDVMHKSRPPLLRPPPIFHPVGHQGRPIQPNYFMRDPYRPAYFMPDAYTNLMPGNNSSMLNHPVRIHDPRTFTFSPFCGSDASLATPSSNGESEAENAPVTIASPVKLLPVSDPPADLPSANNPSPPHHGPSGLSQPQQLPLKRLSKIDVAGTSRSVENLAVERSLRLERSLSVERGATGGKTPILYAAAAAMESRRDGRNTSYGKLMQLLHKEFSTIKRSGLSKYISKIRSKHNNSLTGKCLKDIVHEIRGAIFEDYALNSGFPKDASRQFLPSIRSNSMGLDKFEEIPFSWGVPATQGSLKRYCANSDECYICYDMMDEGDIHNLSCGHAYHSKCIKQWFEVDKTCPTCRLYAPLEEEYPTLQ